MPRRNHCSRSRVCDRKAGATPTVCGTSRCCDHQRPSQQSGVFDAPRQPRSRFCCLWRRQTTTVHRVPESVGRAEVRWSDRSVAGLFFKDCSNGHAAHPGCAGNRTLREAFQRQLFDGGTFVSPFLVFGVECAVGITIFTMELLLAGGGAAIFTQVDRATATTPYGNHANPVSLFENVLA